jgi:hypothetical protein
MDVVNFCDKEPCKLHASRRFGEIYQFHFQGRKSAKPTASHWFPDRLIFDSENGGDAFLRKIGSLCGAIP